jgi:hypothetical protein
MFDLSNFGPNFEFSTKPLHSDKYHEHPKNTGNELPKDEELLALNDVIIRNKKTRQEKNICTYVTQKGNTVILKQTHAQFMRDHGFANPITVEIARYDVKDKEDLIKEMNGVTVEIIQRLHNEKEPIAELNTDAPMMVIEFKENTDRKDIAELLIAKMDDNTASQSQIIIQTLKLHPKLMEEAKKLGNNSHKQEMQMPEEKPKIGFHLPTQEKATVNNKKLKELDKAAEENYLILKYGKKNITKIAKKMGYKGTIINKRGTKAKSKK